MSARDFSEKNQQRLFQPEFDIKKTAN